MKDKEAIDILLKLLKDKRLNKTEKGAISSAIGVLSWTSLAESRIKSIKDKRNKYA